MSKTKHTSHSQIILHDCEWDGHGYRTIGWFESAEAAEKFAGLYDLCTPTDGGYAFYVVTATDQLDGFTYDAVDYAVENEENFEERKSLHEFTDVFTEEEVWRMSVQTGKPINPVGLTKLQTST